jgi:hypothetical protein
MAKTVLAFRHSLKDGPVNTLGPAGINLAFEQGGYMNYARIDKIFHSVVARSIQSALVFLTGWAKGKTTPLPTAMPAILEFGNEELFKVMTAPPEFRALADQVGNFSAILILHHPALVRQWAATALLGLQKVFDQTEEDETAVVITHSPMLELAVWANEDFQMLPEKFLNFSEMSGVVLKQEEGRIGIYRKIDPLGP